MKVSELYAQVAQLGFEDSLDSDKRFLFATERALYQANSIRPHTSAIDVVHIPPTNLLHTSQNDNFEAVWWDSDLPYVVEAAGGAIAYYFEVLGRGRATIALISITVEDGEEKVKEDIVVSFDFEGAKRLKAYRGIIANPDKKTVRISFASDYAMCLKSIALYNSLLSNTEEAIPDYKPYHLYNITELTEDFLAFASPPLRESDGNAPVYDGYDVEGNDLLLSRNLRGVYKVMYQRKIRLPNRETKPSANGETIDLDEELCSALPLLVASYVWLEDEPERAAYYKSLYNERISEISQNKRDYKVTKTINTNGW